MLFSAPAWLVEISLLLLRVLIAAVFLTSGWSHMTRPKERAESIGMSPAFTAGLGVVEVVGAVLVAIGLFIQPATIALMAVMLGAIQKKAFVWKTGFWGDQGGGWYYDLLYLVGNLVILATGGGSYGLL
jgi:putative oxidoreductase